MLIALSGGPGTGKTSVFDKLSLSGYEKCPEVARRWFNLINVHNLKRFQQEPRFFQHLMEINHIKNYTYYKGHNMTDVIFDRTLVDEIAYRRFFKNPVPNDLIEECKRFPVDKVFWFPYWQEIYVQDSERAESHEEAELLGKLLLEAYQEVGYTPIAVPKISVEERIQFILDNI